jgi:hypothetical protein
MNGVAEGQKKRRRTVFGTGRFIRLVNRLKADFSFARVSIQPSDTASKSSDL